MRFWPRQRRFEVFLQLLVSYKVSGNSCFPFSLERRNQRGQQARKYHAGISLRLKTNHIWMFQTSLAFSLLDNDVPSMMKRRSLIQIFLLKFFSNFSKNNQVLPPPFLRCLSLLYIFSRPRRFSLLRPLTVSLPSTMLASILCFSHHRTVRTRGD